MTLSTGRLRSKLLAAVAAVILFTAAAPPLAGSGPSPVTVVVVRHAEKIDDGTRDPGLSEAGKARAQALVDVLAGTDIAAVYTTQYRRTRATAEPLAIDRGLEVQVREITRENMATWFDELDAEIHARYAGRTVVVVGHSNTVPEIVQTLTGREMPPMSEDEYDLVHIVTRTHTDPGDYVRARYGAVNP